MRYFVFRNNTIENLFGGMECEYAGYDDISIIPNHVDRYIWFYQVPVRFDLDILVNEIESYTDKLKYVYSQITPDKDLFIFSLDKLFSICYSNSDFEVMNAINRFNELAQKLATDNKNVKFIDFSEFLNNYVEEQWMDWKFYFISQMIISPKLASKFKQWFALKLKEISLIRKKCLVLDLDNTLWKGVLGEDGIDGIGIGGDYPGKAFLYFQEALIELSKQGIILTVCSKNNENDVIEAWEKNPFIKLNQKYISAYRINWNNKADNIKELAEELNIGLDSFVFIDDNPTERELVKQMLPMVEVPDFPMQPYQLPVFFKSLVDNYFRVYSITEDDTKKTEQYKANLSRKKEQSKFSDLKDYLKSLEIEIVIESANDFNITRIAQMTQKTNQFNLTTKRYVDSDIRSMMNKGYQIYCLSVRDKFGDNGVTGAIIIEPKANAVSIDSLLLSCRILGKGIEFAFIKAIMNKLILGKTIMAEYIPTAKNGQVAEFYDKLKFNLLEETNDGLRRYEFNHLAPYEIEEYYNVIFK